MSRPNKDLEGSMTVPEVTETLTQEPVTAWAAAQGSISMASPSIPVGMCVWCSFLTEWGWAQGAVRWGRLQGLSLPLLSCWEHRSSL